MKHFLLALSLVLISPLFADAQDLADARAKAEILKNQGNYQDALKEFKDILFSPGDKGEPEAADLSSAIYCLRSLQRIAESDALIEETVEKNRNNWWILREGALQYQSLEHNGYIVAGKFNRGYARGGDVRYASSAARDRVRALQLLMQAGKVAETQDAGAESAIIYQDFAAALIGESAWKLQAKTDLGKLPDYEESEYGYWFGRGAIGESGAPVDAEGNAIYYKLPADFDSAVNDGERWRWSLHKTAEVNPELSSWAKFEFARFLNSQFGTQTFAGFRLEFNEDSKDGSKAPGVFALHTLSDNETIARLATGVKRFSLPDEFNFIRIFQEFSRDDDVYQDAVDQLATIYENRRQFSRAAEFWQKGIKEFPESSQNRQAHLDQIVGAWGRFEPVIGQAAGKPASVDFRFRNGSHVSFEAHEIKVQELLSDVMQYLKSNPGSFDYSRVEINRIGYRLVEQDEKKYIGGRVASWNKPLNPADNHFDKRIPIETPLKKAGAYLLTAKMAGGNLSRVILWLNDAAIVKKPLKDGMLYYVADAVTGKPLAGADLKFFGYSGEYVQQNVSRGNVYRIHTSEVSEHTDASGQFIASVNELNRNYQWLVIAHAEGKFAYLGFNSVWPGSYYDAEYNETKAYGITDRPVYRPGQNVKFKVWLRHARYDEELDTENAGAGIQVEIQNPKGEKVYEKQVRLDRYGGFEDSLELSKEAGLGVYRVSLIGIYTSAATFRVEEYKKPEFEVKVEAQLEPVMLGEKIKAKISANYYFGAPVTNAKVHYKVKRYEHESEWYPPYYWDWFYGPGYWWFAYDYEWYPGWSRWGCSKPFPSWMQMLPRNPPELVAEGEVAIGKDGTLELPIDSLPAKELHGNNDHRYEISAEVTDESRRMITGTGSVLAAREPFKVYAWTTRGYYHRGDAIQAEFSALTLDRKPVKGTGKLRLFSIAYNSKGVPEETQVEEWNIAPNLEGRAAQQIVAAEEGQYRLSYTVTDNADRRVEGGYIFTVVGDNANGKDFRFNEIELIPDKQEYEPGETLKLKINTAQADSTVLLFLRPANGAYLKPQVLTLQGKSKVFPVEVLKRDMPNFFVEALTVQDGKVFEEVKEIVVPPEKRVLNLEVMPGADKYKPNEEAHIKLKVTDFYGEPFSGTAVLAVYDKSVEYISGGSNVPEIKEFFWKWRRQHRIVFEASLMQESQNLLKSGEISMSPIGVHGEAVSQTGKRKFSSERRLKGGLDGMISKTAESMDAAALAPAQAPLGLEMKQEAEAGTPEPSAGTVQPSLRKEFADTACWIGTLDIPATGIAEVKFKMPENLTSWKIRSWVLGTGTRVGEGTAEVVTTKDLLLRLQSPRFLVQKDAVVLSANIHNYLKENKSIKARLELPGQELSLEDHAEKTVQITQGGEARVDWRVKVNREGKALIRMFALTDEESDAMEVTLPVYVHGMLKTESWSGTVRGEKADFTIRVPSERRPEATRLEIRYSPTLAGAMIDALPYLANYPYGCTEQTLNRFLPSVITAKVLKEMGLSLAEIKIKRTNLNAQETGNDPDRAKQWKRYTEDPVFDEVELSKMVQAGYERLASMQLSDGSWGWFSGYGEHPDPHITATIVHGLQTAKTAGTPIDPGVLQKGTDWLAAYEAGELQELKNFATRTEPYREHANELDTLVHLVLLDADKGQPAMREFLYRDRNEMSVYGKAMLGLIFNSAHDPNKLEMLLKNLEQYLVRDPENQTAYLNMGNSGYWWHWWGSEYEALAYYLKLLSRVNPESEAASGLVKYLLNNRKHGTYWNSTRDTALVLEAFAEYIKASGEESPDMTVSIMVDGKDRKKVRIARENLFSFDNMLLMEGEALPGGEHKVEIRRAGKGPLYFNAYLTNFTLEDPIASAGLEIKVERKYYKLVREDAAALSRGARGQALGEKVEKYRREQIPDGTILKSGDLVEIELEVDSKNDYEYLVFEDMKPAGLEPLDVRSGYNGNDLGAYVEFRDERVVFFVKSLPRGKRSVSYRMRAETPGFFSALPTRGSGMYAPELRTNSNEIKIGIADLSGP